jgi:hypothetical protein
MISEVGRVIARGGLATHADKCRLRVSRDRAISGQNQPMSAVTPTATKNGASPRMTQMPRRPPERPGAEDRGA